MTSLFVRMTRPGTPRTFGTKAGQSALFVRADTVEVIEWDEEREVSLVITPTATYEAAEKPEEVARLVTEALKGGGA